MHNIKFMDDLWEEYKRKRIKHNVYFSLERDFDVRQMDKAAEIASQYKYSLEEQIKEIEKVLGVI